ncbi:MAG: PAS domain-containing protein [Salinisphaera sp.]|jgi:two-component system sensor kinase FixL|nr:PAS domain-containing protein [Salinisphaera sp.]
MNTSSHTPDHKSPETLDEARDVIHQLQQQLSERTTRLEHAQYNERCFRELAEHIREVFWLTNLLGDQLIYISPAYEKIWGQTCQSLYEDPGTRLAWIHEDDRQRVLTAFKRDAIEGQFDETYRLVRPDGDVRWIRDRAFPIHDDDGNIYRLAGFAVDITQSVDQQDRVSRLCGTLTGKERSSVFAALGTGLAHDLSQPLTAARNFIARAKQIGSASEEEQAAVLASADGEIQRVVAIIHHLRDFARAGRPTVVRQPLKPVLDELQQLLDPYFRAARIAYRAPDNDQLQVLELPLDAVFAQQILRNLLSNAMEALCGDSQPTAPQITLDVNQDDTEHVDIFVSDNGPGISDEVQLFEPYATTKGNGLGLGLSVSRSLAESHGGSLTVASRGGNGASTRFLLRLPR